MKKIILAFGFLSILGAAMAGCGGNDCEAAADDVLAKIEECGGTVPDATDDAEGGECTEAAGTLAKCQAACITAAPCECVVADEATPCSADDATAYLDCLGAC